MNAAGALVLDPLTGDLERKPGFVLNVNAVQAVTTTKHRYDLHGDVIQGYFVKLDDKVELGPFPDAETAVMKARMYAGIWERAS